MEETMHFILFRAKDWLQHGDPLVQVFFTDRILRDLHFRILHISLTETTL